MNSCTKPSSKKHHITTIDDLIAHIEKGFVKQEAGSKKYNDDIDIDLSDCYIDLYDEDKKPISFSFHYFIGKVDYVQEPDTQSNTDTSRVYHVIVTKKIVCFNSFIRTIWFSSTIFQKDVKLSNTTIKGGNMGLSRWNGELYINRCSLKDCGGFSFSNFNRDLIIQNSTFDGLHLDFHNSIFKKRCILSYLTINKQVIIENFIRFTNSKFYNDFFIKHVKTPCNLLLNDIHINGKLEVINFNIQNNNKNPNNYVDLNNSIIKGNFMLKNIKCSIILCDRLHLYSISRIYFDEICQYVSFPFLGQYLIRLLN